MGRIKTIIMDKAPAGGNLSMGGNLGYTLGDLTVLANDVNAEFGTNISPNDLQPLQSVDDVVTFIENQIP